MYIYTRIYIRIYTYTPCLNTPPVSMIRLKRRKIHNSIIMYQINQSKFTLNLKTATTSGIDQALTFFPP